MMARIYGGPFVKAGQTQRWLRRGAAVGLIAEATSPVTLIEPERKPRGQPGTPGIAGPPGPPGTGRLSRGRRQWARTVPGTTTLATWLTAWTTTGSVSSPLVPGGYGSDIDALPALVVLCGGSPNNSASLRSLANSAEFHMGRADGRGGFSIVAQFAFTNLSSTTKRWFVGVAHAAAFVGDPSTNPEIIGVGQDAGDTSPQFMHTDSLGGAVKSPTGFSAISLSRIYEVRIFVSPTERRAQISLQRFAGGLSAEYTTYDSGASVVLPRVPLVVNNAMIYSVNNGPAGNSFAIAFLGFYAEIQPIVV